MSIQRILANNRNAVTTAVLTASSVKPAAAVFPGKSVRKGSGSVRLAGSYTGHHDAEFEVRITSDLGAGRISSPVFAGVGSGKLVDITASDVPAQSVEVELVSLGTASRSAYLDFYGVQLVAKAEGEAGNAVSLFVSEELTSTASGYSLLVDIEAGEDTFTGEEWEWTGITRTLSPSGTLPENCPRIRIQGDSTVYRSYREYTSDGWVYHLTPSPTVKLAAGAKVSVVTGCRTVTVSDGSVTEIYPGVITLYDFLSALRLRSGLMTVQGVVSKSLSPGGMAALDLPLRTAAKAHPPAVSGGWYELKDFADTLTVSPSAPTEIITLDYLGDSLWSVKGTVSGNLAAARTGVPYSDPSSPIGFTIPAAAVNQTSSSLAKQTGVVRITAIQYQSRDDEAGETEPPIIIAASKLGANASAKSITATYKKNRKSVNCEVEELPVTFSSYCLGLPEGGDTMALDPAYASRLNALYQWRRNFIAANTTPPGGSQGLVRYKVTYEQDTSAGWLPQTAYFTTYESAYNFIVRHSTSTSHRNWSGISTEPVAPVSGAAQYLGASSDIAWMERCFALLVRSLETVYPFPTALAMWDSLKNEVLSDLNALASSARDDLYKSQESFLARYTSALDLIYLAAGIVPGKADGADTSAGCWRDMDAAYYWELSEGYAPAYTDEVYYSTTLDGENTHEFACVISCKCTQYLKEGDALSISIAGASGAPTGSTSASITIPIIAGSARFLAGGVDGDDTLTWDVRGSLTAFSQLLMSKSQARYEGSGLSFSLANGGIPFALGDTFRFSIEGGSFCWRKNGGTWSGELPLRGTLLSDGLTAVFTPGAYPSFVAGDRFRFETRQPHSPANVAIPSPEQWRWDSAGAMLTMDFGADTDLDSIALARHELPAASVVTLEMSADGSTWAPLTTLSAASPVIAWIAPETITTRYLRVTIDGAGALGWLFAGLALTTELAPDVIKLRRQYDLTHGPREGAVYGGKGSAGRIEWRNFISKAEFDEHVSAVEYCKTNGDIPLVVVPHFLHPEEAMLVTIETDGIDLVDELQFHPNDATQRMLSLSLPFTAVLQ
jgi:hypothetical protein